MVRLLKFRFLRPVAKEALLIKLFSEITSLNILPEKKILKYDMPQVSEAGARSDAVMPSFSKSIQKVLFSQSTRKHKNGVFSNFHSGERFAKLRFQ